MYSRLWTPRPGRSACHSTSWRLARYRSFADLLVIAESTAKTHVKRVLAKIDVHDRAQAVVFAYRSGLITDGSIDPT